MVNNIVFVDFKKGSENRGNLKLQSSEKFLLHSYDFEDNIVGEDPDEPTLWVKDDPSDGDIQIDNIGDVQQNHVLLHKTGGGKRVLIRDNVSYYGKIYHAGEVHCRIYKPDSSGFEVRLRTPLDEGIHMIFWEGRVTIRNQIYGAITNHPFNEWFDLIVYFNLSKSGWMFDLNGVRFGDGYTIEYDNPVYTGISAVTWSSFASGGGNGYMRVDDISFYYYEYEEKTIIKEYNAEGDRHLFADEVFLFKAGLESRGNEITVGYTIENTHNEPVSYNLELVGVGGAPIMDLEFVDSWMKTVEVPPHSEVEVEWLLRVINTYIMKDIWDVGWEDVIDELVGYILGFFEDIPIGSTLDSVLSLIESLAEDIYYYKQAIFQLRVTPETGSGPIEWESSPMFVLEFLPALRRLILAIIAVVSWELAPVFTDWGFYCLEQAAESGNPYVALAGLGLITLQIECYVAALILNWFVNYVDPPDENYEDIYIPDYSLDISNSTELLNQTYKLKVDYEAYEISLNRKNTALELGDFDTALKQSEAALHYSNEVDNSFSEIKKLKQDLLYELQKFNETEKMLTQENLQNGKDLLEEQGSLPKEEIEMLTAFGFDDDQIEILFQESLEVNTSDYLTLDEQMIIKNKYYDEIDETLDYQETELIEEHIELDVIVNDKEILDANENDLALMNLYVEQIEDAYEQEDFEVVIELSAELNALVQEVLDYTNNIEYLTFIDFALNKSRLAKMQSRFDAFVLSEPLSTERSKTKVIELIITNRAEEDEIFEMDLIGLPDEWDASYDKMVQVSGKSSYKVQINTTAIGNYVGNFDFQVLVSSLTNNQTKIIDSSIEIIDPALVILNDISSELTELGDLIESNLIHKKRICTYIYHRTEMVFQKLKMKYIYCFKIHWFYLFLVKINLYFISRVANDEEITNQCIKITNNLNQVKKYF